VFNSTIENEDYVMGEEQQRTAESGRLGHFVFGRNEAPLHHYHNSFRAALGRPPLEVLE
jgi:Ring hydroxylating alpha subunit (catalytic domain)